MSRRGTTPPGTWQNPAETELYYLQSRYYDPQVGRFINADALVSTGQGLLGNNMFAYCGNNPVSRADTEGTFFFTVLGSLVSGVFGAIYAAISYAQGEATAQEAAASVLGSMASGFVTGLATDVLSITGPTVGVVVGTMAAAGAVGSLFSTGIETLITGNTVDPIEMVSDALYGAGTGALFAYVGFSSSNNWDLIKNGRLLEVIEEYILHNTGKQEVVEEILAGVCDFVLGFTLDILRDRFEQTCLTGG